jgi:hypothetical protein
MARNAVGFYWTLPVPWAGFTGLSNDIDKAAKESLTIRYQRDLIRSYAREEGYLLVHEEVFLEIEPDRGSDSILAALEKVKRICQAKDAVLLNVDFMQVARWRDHGPMARWLHRANIEMLSIYPREILMEDKFFYPHVHFRAWRERQKEWTDKKQERKDKARERAKELLEQGESYPKIADTLNKEKLLSPTGRRWVADNVRSLMKPSEKN